MVQALALTAIAAVTLLVWVGSELCESADDGGGTCGTAQQAHVPLAIAAFGLYCAFGGCCFSHMLRRWWPAIVGLSIGTIASVAAMVWA